MTPVINELGAQFEHTTGHKLIIRFVSGPVVKREIDGGAAFDAVISITPVIDALIKEGKVVAGTLRPGAPKRLGIADAMRLKLKPMSNEGLARAIPSGETEMIVVTMPVITTYGAELVGPIPSELQFYNRFAAGVTDRRALCW